jgi:23S rRNA (pseudouridine1915-N3)-methyltransferase
VKLVIVAVGKVGLRFAAAGSAEYLARLRRYGPVEIAEVKGEPGNRGTAADRLAREGERILRACGDAPVWALDSAGEQFTSAQLAAELTRLETTATRALALAIGGPDGLDGAVLERSARRWSLSALTFPHDLARLILLEALYRARTIQRGEPYHR